MTDINPHIVKAAAAMQSPITFTGTNKARVAQVRLLLSYEGTDASVARLFLDEMSPACRDSLQATLLALEAAITNV